MDRVLLTNQGDKAGTPSSSTADTLRQVLQNKGYSCILPPGTACVCGGGGFPEDIGRLKFQRQGTLAYSDILRRPWKPSKSFSSVVKIVFQLGNASALSLTESVSDAFCTGRVCVGRPVGLWHWEGTQLWTTMQYKNKDSSYFHLRDHVCALACGLIIIIKKTLASKHFL